MRSWRILCMWGTYVVLGTVATVAAILDVIGNGAVRIPMLVQTFMFYVVVYFCWRAYAQLRDDDRKIRELTHQSVAAMVLVKALADRGAMVACDDCGNLMPPDVAIDVMERPDGTMYVGHASHQRAHDWGYR